MRNKENAFDDMLDMFFKSWTYARFTESEKTRFQDAFIFVNEQNLLSGNYEQRCKQMHILYNSFLMGIGYDPHITDWRGNK